MQKFILLLSLSLYITACMTGGVSHIDSKEGFDWDSLKRDQILMSHLLDLRSVKKAPNTHQDKLEFFSKEETVSYPESFKQVFFKIRKDIRIFGAGGAFETVNTLSGIREAAEAARNKKPVKDETLKLIRTNNQGIRFLMFFAMDEEKLEYNFKKSVSSEGCRVKSYSASRIMGVKSVLWDSQKNETPWVGTKVLAPNNVSSVRAGYHWPTIRKNKRKARRAGRKFKMPKCGVSDSSFSRASLASELKRNLNRFPDFPEREPYFSSSFKDFALSLPMGQSEKNWIEYDNFTNNRFGIAYSSASFSGIEMGGYELQFSSRIYNRYRLGARVQGVSGEEGFFSHSLTTASISGILEFDVHEKWQLAAGFLAGFGTYDVSEITSSELNTTEDELGISESSMMLNPAIGFQYGTKYGGQLYFQYISHNFTNFNLDEVDNNNQGESFNIGYTYTWLGF